MITERTLITGGLGFIGMKVAELLVSEGRRVILFDNLSQQIHGPVPDLASSSLLKSDLVEVVRGDVRSFEDWRLLGDALECVIHLAAETGTAQSMYAVARYTNTNVCGTANLLDFLANSKHSVKKIILASSRSVYGEGAYDCRTCGRVYPSTRSDDALREGRWEPLCPICDGPIQSTATREDSGTSPASIYAATKLAQENLVSIASKALGIPVVILRFQNVYGEGQSLKNPYTGILSIFSNQLRQGVTVNLYEDGQESRDFVHVSDVADAVVRAANSSRADGMILNVGSGRPTTVERVALLLKKNFGVAQNAVSSGQYRLGDIRHGYADLSMIQDRLGFIPQVSLEEGLERFSSWVKTQKLEPDLLGLATRELRERGLMSDVEAKASAI